MCPPSPYRHSVPYYPHPTPRGAHLLQTLNPHCHATFTGSPQFTFGSLCGGAPRLALKMKKSPPSPIPWNLFQGFALRLVPRVTFGERGPGFLLNPCSKCPLRMFLLVHIFFFFLLEMSLLAMNVGWFVLKLANCL